MTRLTIDLPDDVARELEEQAREEGKSREQFASQTVTDWLSRRRQETERFHQLIREGDESGEPIPVNDAYFEQLRERLRERLRQRVVQNPSAADTEAEAS